MAFTASRILVSSCE